MANPFRKGISGPVWENEVLWESGNWRIHDDPRRRFSVAVVNEKTGVTDYPILYPHSGEIAYDRPERVPKHVQNATSKILYKKGLGRFPQNTSVLV